MMNLYVRLAVQVALIATAAVLWSTPVQASDVIVLGDSITKGDSVDGSYPERLGRLLWRSVENLGVDGADTFDGVSAINEALAKYHPKVAVIFYGANDAIMGNSPMDSIGNLKYMVEHIKAVNCLPIMATVMPMFSSRSIFNGRVESLNALILKLAVDKDVELVDLHSVFLDHPELFVDGLHPNAAGLDIIAGQFAEAIWTSERNRWPDFGIREMKMVPGAPAPGERVRVTVTVENFGDVDGNAGQLDLWLDHGAVALPVENGDRRVAVGRLPAHHTRKLVFNVCAPTNSGDLTLRAWVDSRCAANEYDEDNNQSTLSYPCKPLTGLTVSGPSAVDEGRQESYTCTAHFLDGTSADVTDGGTRWVINSKFATINVSGILTTRTTLVADQSCTITAFYGGRSATFSIAIQNSIRPDYVVSALSLSPARPSAGKYFTVYATVSNQGAAKGSQAYLDVWADRGAAVTGGERGDVSVVVPALVPAQARNLVVRLKAPANPMARTLRAIVDSRDRMVEVTETNNQNTVDYIVVP